MSYCLGYIAAALQLKTNTRGREVKPSSEVDRGELHDVKICKYFCFYNFVNSSHAKIELMRCNCSVFPKGSQCFVIFNHKIGFRPH